MRGNDRQDDEAEFWTPDVGWASPGSAHRHHTAASGERGLYWHPDQHGNAHPDQPLSPTTRLPRPLPARRGRGRAWLGLALGVAATIALAGIGFVVLDLDERVNANGDNAVVRLPVDTAGPNPFTPPLGHDQPGARAPGFLEGDETADASPGPGGGGGPRPVPADVPGRYAGSRDNAECGKELLVDYLAGNAVVASAWTRALGVETAGFSDYADTLTPVVLRFDTLVTDHTLADGVAVPSVSVLQAGTAVLVDGRGLPVTRCLSGSPLTPAGVPPGVTYSGPQWPGFAPADVVRLDPPSEPVRTFVLADLATGGGLFSRPAGTTGSDDRDFRPIAEVDFLTTTYDVGCADPAGPVTISVTEGEGSLAAGSGVRRLVVVDLVTADLTGDDAVETAVLLSCEAEDADYVVTEVQVFGDGPAMLTTLTPPAAAPPLVLPYFAGDTFEVSDGRLRASVWYYDFGSGDTLSSGPSVQSVVSWTWDGGRLVPELGVTTTGSPPPRPRPSGSATASPRPGASASAGASASMSPGTANCLGTGFVANWQGSLTRRQAGTTASHQAVVALSGGCVGDVVGSTYYPGLGCGGALTLVSGGDRPVFTERRTTAASSGSEGGGSCEAERDLRVQRSGADLEVTATGSSGSTSSTTTGTLQRR